MHLLRPRLTPLLLAVLLLASVPALTGAQGDAVTLGSRPPVSLHYTTVVRTDDFETYEVLIRVRHADGPTARFLLPRWAPGAYRLVAWHEGIDGVGAMDAAGGPLTVMRLGTNTWEVAVGEAEDFTFRYTVAAPTPVDENGRPRLNNRHYLHTRGGLIDGPRSWMYLEGAEDHRTFMHFDLPPDWRVATGLHPTTDPLVYWAEDYDWLIDCPTMIGSPDNLHIWEFTSWDVPFAVAYDAAGDDIRFDHQAFVASLKRICDCQASIFGGFPFTHFVFLYDNGGGGGLEHLRSTTIGGPAQALENDAEALWNISAHEFYHVWNVKRLRPEVLGPFDYQQPNRTESLWWSEGVTETYTAFTGVRAGFMSPQDFYEATARSIAAWMGSPAQPFAPPARMSWTTWDGPERNPQGRISYYTQGEVLGIALDLILREATDNRRSLDDVTRILMWEHGGEDAELPGFGTEDIIHICEDVAGIDLYEFFEHHVTGTVPPDWAHYLGYAGLDYTETRHQLPDEGFRATNTEAGPVIRSVTSGSAPARAGLRPGDRVVTVGGETVRTSGQVASAVRNAGVGGRVEWVVEGAGERRTLSWVVEAREVLEVRIAESADADERQLRIRRGLLTGETDPSPPAPDLVDVLTDGRGIITEAH
jgi:predicted metalloprotease with PDZ domain